MSLSRLAEVELQWILLSCDTSSRLRLARCSRWTLRSADSAVVWRGAPTMIDVPLDDEAGCARLRFSSSGLLRHAAVRVLARWVAPPLPPVPPVGILPPTENVLVEVQFSSTHRSSAHGSFARSKRWMSLLVSELSHWI
jgi:hypothetical protein